MRILFYTDDASVILGTSTDFGVGRLDDLVVNHDDFHATCQVDVLNRHASGHATYRLTAALLAGYDQV